MPADARSLLRAAAAQKRAAPSSSAGAGASSSSSGGATAIPDRFASYHRKTGALRCLACDLTIKHESLWASHAASKSHRAKAEEIKRAEAEEAEKKQRKAEEEEAAQRQREAQAAASSSSAAGKRKGEQFSSEDGGQGDQTAKKRAKINEEQNDTEWERFQREVMSQASESDAQPDRGLYSAGATIEVAPKLRQVPGRAPLEDGEEEIEEEAEEEEETEEEKRARLDREEREEIMARFEEEQRIQDEANER